MVTYTLTDLSNRSGEVVEAACRGPVEITKHGRRKFVLLTAKDFDRLVRRGMQRSRRVENLTDEERHDLLAGLATIAGTTGVCAEAP
jgi:prevent-host-death family protein